MEESQMSFLSYNGGINFEKDSMISDWLTSSEAYLKPSTMEPLQK